MQVLAMLVVGMVVVLQLPREGMARCCHSHYVMPRGRRCNDCTKGTPYCAYGPCNILGCNCDGGCRPGNIRDCDYINDGRRDVIDDAHDVIRRGDADGDGQMSLEEAHSLVARMGFPVDHVERELRELDQDNDQFLSAGEIDSEFKETLNTNLKRDWIQL